MIFTFIAGRIYATGERGIYRIESEWIHPFSGSVIFLPPALLDSVPY